MPNYDGKKPLKLTCPVCGTYGMHPVEKTQPANYYWGAARTPFFKRIAGADISYRLRYRRCVKCSNPFRSVEMPYMFLQNLMGEVERLETVISDLRAAARLAAKTLVQAADGSLKRPKTKKRKT